MSRYTRALLVAAFLGVLAMPARSTMAQVLPRYIAIDLGTFGGPNNSFSIPSPLINDQGTAVGDADTAMTDPFAPNNCLTPPPTFAPDCYAHPAFAWRNGVLTNLGALPGAPNSFPNWISPNGLIAGESELPTLDPMTGGPAFHAVLWKDGQIQDLGTLGGLQSLANAVNDRGQVVGAATTTTPDSFPAALNAFGFFDFVFTPVGVTQNRAFLWQNGHMQDLGTLGGKDAQATQITQGGQIAGWSTTGVTPNSTTGIPTVEPFLWHQGRMQSLGTLGGTFAWPEAMNDRGDITGTSTLPGDQAFHPFLWAGGQLKDLGTLGGSIGQSHWINQAGDVAGWTFTTGNATVHAVLWKDGGTTDLGTLPGKPCSFADFLNAQDQVVGGSCRGTPTAWLWEHGTMSDLNTLVAPTSIFLNEALAINDRGEIFAIGTLANGEHHDILLVPSGLAASEGLRSNVPAPESTSSATVSPNGPARIELRGLLQAARVRPSYLRAGDALR
jgi:probable HAF family extracellular repeat protein